MFKFLEPPKFNSMLLSIVKCVNGTNSLVSQNLRLASVELVELVILPFEFACRYFPAPTL